MWFRAKFNSEIQFGRLRSGSREENNRYFRLCRAVSLSLCMCAFLDDHNRVKLQVADSSSESDYVNASYIVSCRGGVEDTRLEAKDTKNIQGQGQPFRGQTLSRPRTGMLEAKDQGHKRKCSPKKGLHKNFSSDLPKKKVFTKISTKKRFPKNVSSAPQNFNNSKNTAVLEPRTGQFSRTWASRPRT